MSGGDQYISDGGSATNTVIDGTQYISSGGNAIETTIENGFQEGFQWWQCY
ncbi:hypothetical protein ACLB1S_32075 [Escherichia coli]